MTRSPQVTAMVPRCDSKASFPCNSVPSVRRMFAASRLGHSLRVAVPMPHTHSPGYICAPQPSSGGCLTPHSCTLPLASVRRLWTSRVASLLPGHTTLLRSPLPDPHPAPPSGCHTISGLPPNSNSVEGQRPPARSRSSRRRTKAKAMPAHRCARIRQSLPFQHTPNSSETSSRTP